jgi:hypothetical protein
VNSFDIRIQGLDNLQAQASKKWQLATKQANEKKKFMQKYNVLISLRIRVHVGGFGPP